MKHKQYESWIFNEAHLKSKQQQELDSHLNVCDSCRVLRVNWIASQQLILQSVKQIPAPGFINRWRNTYAKKCRNEKVRRHRLTIFGLLLLAFISSFIYLLASKSFMRMLANGFTMISEIVMGITNGLSTISYWLGRLPIAVPITAGFLYLGMITSFFMVGLLFLWNIRQRKLLTDEITVD